MTTIQELINELQKIEDKQQPVISKFYIAEHFIYNDENITVEQFTKAIENLDTSSLFDDISEELSIELDSLLTDIDETEDTDVYCNKCGFWNTHNEDCPDKFKN